ncbi:MAG: LysE family translocator [Rhodoblastus sp.]|nr:MAG: LysE family translocator [Rhodoblastus sp.]
MIAPATALAFAGASFALAVTPGPDMMLCASRAATQGRGVAFMTLAGICCGLFLHALFAGLGLSQLLLASPNAIVAVRWAGAGYLLWLAIRTLTTKPDPVGDAAQPRAASMAAAFRVGLLTNLLNAKVILFVLALYPQFVTPSSGAVLGQMLTLGAINNVVGFAVNGVVILVAARLGRGLSSGGRFAGLGRWFLAAVFGGLAARLAWG